MQQGQIVLVDTNIIIEAFRARCWKVLTAYYRVETVEKCYEEALTGDRLRPGYVEVDSATLKEKLVINRVASLELAALAWPVPTRTLWTRVSGTCSLMLTSARMHG